MELLIKARPTHHAISILSEKKVWAGNQTEVKLFALFSPWWRIEPVVVCAGGWSRLTETSVTEEPIRDWRGQTVTSLLGLGAPQVHVAFHAKLGSDKWIQFPFAYLSVVWYTEHTLACPCPPPPPINLYPVTTTPANQHISAPPLAAGPIKHTVTHTMGKEPQHIGCEITGKRTSRRQFENHCRQGVTLKQIQKVPK